MHICCGGFILSITNLTSSVSFQVDLVNYSPFLLRTIWPLSLTMDGGRWFLIMLYVRPGNTINYWFAIVVKSVEFGDKHSIWLWYIASSARVLVLVILYLLSCDALIAVYAHLTLGWTLIGSTFLFCGGKENWAMGSLNGTIQGPVLVHLSPFITILPRYVTEQPILVKLTPHPALHKWTTDSSEWYDNNGMMCASLALAGRSGSANVHAAVDFICVPSGNFTVRGSFPVGYLTLVLLTPKHDQWVLNLRLPIPVNFLYWYPP